MLDRVLTALMQLSVWFANQYKRIVAAGPAVSLVDLEPAGQVKNLYGRVTRRYTPTVVGLTYP